jgi:ATP-binding cassette subfamily F protein uup
LKGRKKKLAKNRTVTRRSGTKVFKVKNLTKHIGYNQYWTLNFEIRYGDRIHIVGANGTGKQHLIKMLLGEIKNDSGIIEIGENIKWDMFPRKMPSAFNFKVIELF